MEQNLPVDEPFRREHARPSRPSQLTSPGSADPIDGELLCQQTFIRAVQYQQQVTSTNDWALELSRRVSSAQLPLLLLTDSQTAGRGRGTNRWWAAEGALPLSVLLEPAGVPACELPKLSLTVGLAVARAMAQFLDPARIMLKWPNDVLVDNRKICGVLVERPAGSRSRLIVGIGVNVNNSIQTAPSELTSSAIALCDASGSIQPRQRVLHAVLNELESCLELLVRDARQLVDQWRPLCWLTGRRVVLDVYARRLQGICEGIDDAGALCLKTATGMERCLGGVVISPRAGHQPPAESR